MNTIALPTRKDRSGAYELPSSPSLTSHPECLDDAGTLTDDPRGDAPGGLRLSDRAHNLAPAEDVEAGDAGHQGAVQLGFRDSYPSKRGFYPFSDGPTDSLPHGVVVEISRLHRKQGTALPWDIAPKDRAGLDACQFRQLRSQGCGVINRHAKASLWEDLYPEAHALAERLYQYATRRWGIYAFSARQCLRPAEAALDYTHIPGNEPSEESFRKWQRENGQASGQARRDRCSDRDRFIIDAYAVGDQASDIASKCAVIWPHLGHSPSTISRVLAREKLARTIKDREDDVNSPLESGDIESSTRVHEGSCNAAAELVGQVAEAPPVHWALACWYANVGAYLNQERTDRLIEFADRIGAEELAGAEFPNGQGLLWLVDEVIDQRCSTKDHPAAYLMQCIDNHGQGLSAELVRETVQAVGFGFDHKAQYFAAARNPVAYLTSLRNGQVGTAGVGDASPMGVGLLTLKRWSPELVTPEFEAEAQDLITWERRPGRFVEDHRRRFGRLPWEIQSDAEVEPASPGEEPTTPVKTEQPEYPAFSRVSRETRPDPRHGEALQSVERPYSTCEVAGDEPVLEHGPCRHPLAGMLALALPLDNVQQVDCSTAGCGCSVYSDRDRGQCPCHWSPAKAAAVGRALQAQLASGLTAPALSG